MSRAPLGKIRSIADRGLGATVLLAVVMSRVVFGRLRRRRGSTRRLLILDSSYTLDEIRDRGLERAILSRDLDGHFEHVWTVHPMVGAARDAPDTARFGPITTTTLSDRHTFIEGRVAPGRRLRSWEALGFAIAQARLFVRLDRLMRAERIGLVRSGDPHYKGLVGLALARTHGALLVTRVAGNYETLYQVTGRTTNARLIPSRRWERRIERFVLRRCALVIGPNRDNLDFAIAQGADPARAAIIGYGNLLHPDHLKEPTERRGGAEAAREAGVPAGAPFAVFVGRLEPGKHAEDLVPIMAALHGQAPDLHLVIVGDGSARGRIEAQADRLGIGGHLHVAGFRGQPWIARLLPAAALVLSPHMGRALVECALAGLPIVAYDIDWQAEFVSDGVNGRLVAFGDRGAMARAARELLDRPDHAKALGREARALARARFDPDRLTQAERACYERLEARHDAGPPHGVRPTADAGPT